MSIRQVSVWNPIKNDWSGHISCGTIKNEDDEAPIARNALVYFIVGSNFKIPVAYFLLNGLRAEDRTRIRGDIITKVSQTRVVIAAFVFDGLSAAYQRQNNLAQTSTKGDLISPIPFSRSKTFM